MDNKTLSIVSYITVFGWLISFIAGKEKADTFLKYHLKQGLGLVIFTFIWGGILRILMSVTTINLFWLLGSVPLILIVIGMINAANEVQKPLPFIGKAFEDKFSFIG